jgi:DNA-binding CsgD family transcriptional regulator
MAAYDNLPWTCINDYLVDIGSVTNINEFCRRVLKGLANLIPFDNNGIFAIQDSTGYTAKATFVESAKWSEQFNNYYWKLMPPIPGSRTAITDWRDYANSEYVTYFISPQRIGSTISALHLGANMDYIGGFALHRNVGTSCFTQRDMFILDFIEPHLYNYFTIISLLATYDAQLPDATIIASDFKCLTRREAEVAALLCRRFSTGMIASRLLISIPTVYRYIANIFEKLKVFSRDELLKKLLNE